MGTGRGKNALRRADKKRKHPNIPEEDEDLSDAPATKTPRPDNRPSHRIRLRTLIHKGGMSYPFPKLLMKRAKHESQVTKALQRGAPHIKYLKTATIDRLLASVFEEAVAALREPDVARVYQGVPIRFIVSLKERPALVGWAGELCANRFASLFLILRAARVSWFEDPTDPFKLEHHARVARAIDAFREIETFDWSGAQVAKWLVYSNLSDEGMAEIIVGMTDHLVIGQNEDAGNVGDSEDELFVKQTTFIPAEEDADSMEVDGDNATTSTTSTTNTVASTANAVTTSVTTNTGAHNDQAKIQQAFTGANTDNKTYKVNVDMGVLAKEFDGLRFKVPKKN